MISAKNYNLYKIVLQGFAVNDIIEKNKQNIEDMVKYIDSLDDTKCKDVQK